MSLLMGLNVMAVVGPITAKPVVQAGSAGRIDAVMVLGFFAAFCTIVVVAYGHNLRTRLPMLLMCLVSLTVYGFLQGTWALGFSLATLSASEFRKWFTKKPVRQLEITDNALHANAIYESDSRVVRMFGSL